MTHKKLTPTMQKALNHAREHGGKLARYPGGFWAATDVSLAQGWGRLEYFGTTTIHALVDRGVMAYSNWQGGRNGNFPIEVTIV